MHVPTYIGGAVDEVFGNSPVVSGSCGPHFTLTLTSVGVLYSFRFNIDLAMGHLETNSSTQPKLIESRWLNDNKIVAMACGRSHAAAVSNDGKLYTWGTALTVDGYLGGLGHVDEEDHRVPTLVDPLMLSPIRLTRLCYLTDTCVGRFVDMQSERALAFAMGTHPRLGGGNTRISRRLLGKSPGAAYNINPCVYVLMPVELIMRVIANAKRVPTPHYKMPDAVARMIGRR